MITDLNERLERHKKWLLKEPGGECLVLPNADLQGANLQGAYLYKANLHEVHLQRDNLEGTDLREANLQEARLRWAKLYKANLQGANLQKADLSDTNLQGANLQGANLQGANLQRTDLRRANLLGANLLGANLQNAELYEANLQESILPDFQKMTDSELVIGWKKVRGDILLMLEITGQRTCTLTSNVCRCSEAKVLEAFTSEGTYVHGQPQFMSLRDNSFLYEIGKVVRAPQYNGDIRMMGAPGIHFFLTRKEAENYYG